MRNEDGFRPGDIVFLDTAWSLGPRADGITPKPYHDISGKWVIDENGTPSYLKILASQLLSLSDDDFNKLIVQVSSQRLGLDDE